MSASCICLRAKITIVNAAFLLAAMPASAWFESSGPRTPLYGINPPNGWQAIDFEPVPGARDGETVNITVVACADLNGKNEYVRVNAVGGRDFGDLFTGDSGTGCAGDCDTVVLTMTAAEWNAARAAGAGGVGGVRFDCIPSAAVTNICCNDTCSQSGPGGSSECCPTQCTPIPCYRGSITITVSYPHVECDDNGDCDDGNPCTTDTCSSQQCIHFNNNNACGDGVFCNGTDTCSGGTCSIHSGNPCTGGNVCCESSATCAGCCAASDCNDSVDCTSDSCVSGSCSNLPVHGNCDDGNLCTTDSCDPGDPGADPETGCGNAPVLDVTYVDWQSRRAGACT